MIIHYALLAYLLKCTLGFLMHQGRNYPAMFPGSLVSSRAFPCVPHSAAWSLGTGFRFSDPHLH